MNVLVISPHPDDETLGAGGTLLKLKNEGHNIAWLNITMASEEYGYSNDFVEKRHLQMKSVIEEYGFDEFYNLDLEPAGLDKVDQKIFVSQISNIFLEYKPEIIFVPYAHDVHSDHRIVSEVVYSCTKAFRYPFVKAVFEMEILSETDFANPENGFIPNVFVNIEDYIDKKIEIMNLYESEIKEVPFPRSVENIRSLATVRGCSSGSCYAEGFRLIKANW